ncbi:MAG: PAS domain S-box protein [Desulfobacteraceae bacterium]|nr:MAG: PAS domain S-box protein [Desulfobacteraceae bacterium]
MPNLHVEKRLRHDSAELNKLNELLEEKLQEKELTISALQNSEKQYRRLFESAKDGILILDADTGKVVDVNPFLLALLGYSYDAVFGRHLWQLGAFKDIAASKDAFIVLQDNQYIRYEDLPLLTLDGRRIAVEFVSNVYLVDGKKVIQCNIRDISARKLAEKVLGESEAKRRSILDNISIGVALISPQMQVLELNQQLREWFPAIDIAQGPICYRAFNDPPLEAACVNCPTVKTLQDGAVHEMAFQNPRAGATRNYRIVSSPVRNAAGEIAAAIELIEDITERLSLESQFRQAQKLESVGRLAGGVAHDYNNMLSLILGYAELALGKVNPSEPVHDDLREILNAAKRSAEVTRQLLAFARKQTIAPKLIDLNDTVEGILRMLRRLIGEDIELTWLPGANLGPIMMDPSQLDQIMANLCVNARDAIADVGKITIQTGRVTFDQSFCDDHEGFVPGDFIELTVSDSGCGMDRKTQENIFEPFFTTKRAGRGTGLGLSTVYGIIKQNNGLIKAWSEPGKGTTFRIYLQSRAGEAADRWEEIATKTPKAHGETILIAEDEVEILKLIKIMLETMGYTVLTANTAADAMRLAQTHAGKIRLLITDVVMPEMNGRELAERLRSFEPNLNCLFMSGYTSDVIAHLGVLNKGVSFIQKPFSMKHLAAKVHEALGQPYHPLE